MAGSVTIEILRLASLFVTVLFLSYIMMILVPFLRRKPTVPGDPDGLAWHVFVPARDEEVVIGRTVRTLRTRFPQAHVWVVDDDSEDRTRRVVSDLAARDPAVHLVQRRLPLAREGKGAALNAAYAALHQWLPSQTDRKQVVVAVVDADGLLARGALAKLSGPTVFGDPDVGGAQIAVRMENRRDIAGATAMSRLGRRFSHVFVVLQDMEFMTSMAAMQGLRERTGSVGLGGNGQFARLSALDAIAREYRVPWHGALLEDYELGLHILLAGYRNRFVYDTQVEQEGLLSVRRLLVQRTRWSQGTMQCTGYLPALVRSRNFSNAGMLEAGYFVLIPWMQLLGVIVWPVLAVVGVFQAAAYPGGAPQFFAENWSLAILIAVFGLGPFVIWGPIYRRVAEPGLNRRTAWLLGFANAMFQYYTYVTTIRAFYRLLARRSGWAKTRRNAEVQTTGPVASDV